MAYKRLRLDKLAPPPLQMAECPSVSSVDNKVVRDIWDEAVE